ncbi:MAG: cell division protein FtsL [Mariniflexile sp.]|jgi:cell division protein FtsL
MKTNKLHTIKKAGFKVPKNYFKSLEDVILNDIKLKEIAPSSGYKLPENYFDLLENKITSTVIPHKKVKVINLFTWRKAIYVAAVAASFILMFNIFFNDTKIVTLDTIETASIENYIINEELETNEIASLFTDDDLSEVHLINDTYNSETLENYVFDNLEIEDIITN